MTDIVAGMATMPTRAHSLPIALASILPQLQRLYLYLDFYDNIPEVALSNTKIIPIRHDEYPGLHSNGKFAGILKEKSDCYYFSVDDDIVYPSNYTLLMSAAMKRYRASKERVVVGVHSAILKQPFARYRDDRKIFNFAHPLDVDTEVDIIGTGTAAFHTSDLKVDPRKWDYTNIDDLSLAIEAEKQKVKRIAIERGEKFLKPIAELQPDSCFAKLLEDDSLHTVLAKKLIDIKSRRGSLLRRLFS